jgi:hypothetical protein
VPFQLSNFNISAFSQMASLIQRSALKQGMMMDTSWAISAFSISAFPFGFPFHISTFSFFPRLTPTNARRCEAGDDD